MLWGGKFEQYLFIDLEYIIADALTLVHQPLRQLIKKQFLIALQMFIQFLKFVFRPDAASLMARPISFLMLRGTVHGLQANSASELGFLVAEEAELDIGFLVCLLEGLFYGDCGLCAAFHINNCPIL